MCRVARTPSIPGIAKSMTVMSGSKVRTLSTASSPDDAPPTTCTLSGRLEQRLETRAHDLVVVDQHDPHHGPALWPLSDDRGMRGIGTVARTVVPFPGAAWMTTSPPTIAALSCMPATPS